MVSDLPANLSARGPAPKLQRERVSQLPKSQQRFVEQMLETVLAQAARNA